MAKEAKGYFEGLTLLVERQGSVQEFKDLWDKHFNDKPTEDHIKRFSESKREKYEHEGGDEANESYEESYEESYD